ncbi:unnamed protein product [Tilletia controversa]|nr:unnamed protein product [Tilletia controversa]
MPLESFTSPELMMWTLADAQKLHTNRKFGKEEVTRDMDGNPIDKELVNEIETAVSIACSELDDIVLPEWLKNKPRNYDLYRANYLRRLIVICQGLEKRFPVLSWCTMHYKALFWIQKHLKSKCESVATAKRKAESLKRSRVGDDSDIDNEAIAKNGAARPSPRKKQNAPATTSRTSKNVGKGKQKAKEKSGKESDNSMTSEEDNGDDDEESDEEGDKTNATRFQSNVRSLFSGKSSTTAQNSAHVGASVGSSTRTTAQVTANTSRMFIPSRPSPVSESSADPSHSAGPSRLADTSRRMEPSKSPLRSSPLRRSSSGSIPPLSLSKCSAADIRAGDNDRLTDPTISALLSALKTKYSGLEERVSVLRALHALENAEEYGFDPEQDGDTGFLKWLAGLEEAVPDVEDPDKSGISFGHDEIGTWRYHDALKNRITFGSVRNACRLLAALLRIWAIAKEERDKTGMGPQPVIKLHIQRISEYIEDAFKTDLSSSQAVRQSTPLAVAGQGRSETAEDGNTGDIAQNRAAPLPLTDTQLTDTQLPQNAINAPSASNTHGEPASQKIMPAGFSSRSRGAVELKNGIVTEASLKSLGKASLVEILGHASKPFEKGEKKEALLNKLKAGIENGTVVLTSTQVKCAKAGLPIPDIKDIKGTKKNKSQ